MNSKFTFLLLAGFFLFKSNQVSAQADGDYRSNVAATGTWASAASWQRYNGTTMIWEAAGAAPTSADGVITIRATDSIRLNIPTTIDQVVVENGGALTIFALSAITVTVADGAGDDIVVNSGGRLYVAAFATLVPGGAGTTIVNNVGGILNIRNTSNYQVNTTSLGTLVFGQFGQAGVSGGTVTNATITSSGDVVWVEGNNITFNNATLNSTGPINIVTTQNATWTNVGASAITSSDTIQKTSATGTVTIQPAFTNTGVIHGPGTYSFTALTNNGTVDPGTTSTAAILTITNNVLSDNSTVRIDVVNSSGPIPGVGHDQLAISTGGVTTLDGDLRLFDPAVTHAPVGVYTIMTTTGTFAGAFDNVILPSNYIYLGIVGGNTVQVQKTALFPLPLTWGTFTANAVNDKVVLNWTTLQEVNTSHFVVEHSTDGLHYVAIGNVASNGNSTEEKQYSFTQKNISKTKNHFYRIAQLDLDNKKTYSSVRVIRFTRGKLLLVHASPNPVRDQMRLTVQSNDVDIQLVDFYGRTLRNWKLQAGVHSVDIQSLPSGTYQLMIYQNDQKVDSQRIIKL